MMPRNAFRSRLAKLGGSFASLAVGLLTLALAGSAHAGAIFDPTNCFQRTYESSGRTIDYGPETGDPETGNYLYRLDQFELQPFLEGCFSADVLDVSVVTKNPFDIPGPDVLNGASFSTLRDQMEADFPAFGLWDGLVPTRPDNLFDPNDPNDLNHAGFQGVSVCIFLGDDIGNSSNLQDCLDGVVTRIFLPDVFGTGMVFSASLGDSSFFLCGECADQAFEMVTILYSDFYGDGMDSFAHPQTVHGWDFFPVVPEPSALALLAPGFAFWAARRRRRPVG